MFSVSEYNNTLDITKNLTIQILLIIRLNSNSYRLLRHSKDHNEIKDKYTQ